MPRENLTTIDDPRLEPYRHLKATNETRWAGEFIVEGEKLVQRLLDSRYEVRSILVDERSLPRLPETIPESLEVLVVPDGAVEAVVGFNFHRGMLACAKRPPALELSALVETGRNRQTLVVCPMMDDPENLGAILRIAAAFGVDGVLLGERCPDHLSRRVFRVSMGTVLRLPVVRSEHLARDFDALKNRGFDLAAAVTDTDAEELITAVRGPRLALVLGNEGHGLDPEWVGRCTRRVTIGMQPGIDSLNVAVAAGICLYHFSLAVDEPTCPATEQ